MRSNCATGYQNIFLCDLTGKSKNFATDEGVQYGSVLAFLSIVLTNFMNIHVHVTTVCMDVVFNVNI